MTGSLDDRLDAIFDAVLDYEDETTERLVREELAHGTDLHVILNDSLIAAMDEVGDLFSEGVLFVPEMLMAARAMKAGLEVLRPLLTETDAKPIGKVVLGTVHRDLHDIGKNLVGMMLEGSGFEVVDLGTDVSSQAFVNAVREHEPQVIGMSALLTTTMPSMGATIEALEEAGLREGVKVMIGGAPITQDFADKVGADGFAPDASSATRQAKALVGAA